ncbi:gliding motility-associated protein GldE [Orenia metallireducens]|jgi:gliding motility-associated protein GldE|uniref:Gliding motility-associated protein GldE n=1 Tax=Orenia metallireducens TaxID=1413210 RepID=A0A285G673_9FIRM|nr:hemolysin family protein [Orenia metallireducens]PRX28337.1 gliding motility-associated protein GldE [Orenia metallireducens]SNY18843.1 gliding motility-associated protein GldE [Orenia metallireducens]
MDLTVLIEGIALLILLILSGFFSSSETALMSVNKVEIRHLKQEGNKKATVVDRLLSSPDRLLVTILVGNNLVNIAASSIATALATDIFGAKGVGIAIGAVTLFVLIFGEITPKSFATKESKKVSMLVAPYIEVFSFLLSPLIKGLTLVTNFVMRRSGDKKVKPFISEEEIMRFLTVGEQEGVIETDEKQMINSIFEFDDISVKEIMIPRIHMLCIEINDPLEELIDLIINMGFSRIPVYNDTVDNIVGVVYAKDLLPLLKEDSYNVDIQKIMRPAYYIPETKKIDNLLTEFRKEKIHMAIILDEYGGTAGLVTIEDLLEEIVGDIQDEYDEEEKWIRIINEDEILIDGRVDIDEINELLEISLPEEDYETISGFILSMLGYVPKAGEWIEFEDLHISVEKVIQRRISKVRIKRVKDKVAIEQEEV